MEIRSYEGIVVSLCFERMMRFFSLFLKAVHVLIAMLYHKLGSELRR
jgi:hypothetical protein